MRHAVRVRLILTAVICVCVIATQPLTAQSVFRVDSDAAPGGDGSSWTSAIDDLQVALGLAASSTPAEIWIRAGSYTPGASGEIAATFQLASGVALYGGFDGTELTRDARDTESNETILSGDLDGDDVYVPGTGWTGYSGNSAHIVTAGSVDATAIIDGVTIEGGAITSGVTYSGYGSGVLSVGGTPTLRACHLRRNYGTRGGAIYLDAPALQIEGCSFEDNIAWLGFGAGLYVSAGHATITDSTFTGNEAVGGGSSEGGGAGVATWFDGSVDIARSDFSSNTARNFYAMGDTSGAYGACVYNAGPNSTFIDCRFWNNNAHAGGGIFNWGDNVMIANCLFYSNHVQSYDVSPVVSQGGGGAGVAATAFASYTTHIIGCTFVANTGSEGVCAISYGSHRLDIVNSIFWATSASDPETVGLQKHVKGHTDVAYSCAQDFWIVYPGEDPLEVANFPGCFDDDPLFADAASHDYHLAAGSPCIDAGDSASVPAGVLTDLDGADRRVDDPATVDSGVGGAPIVDLGVYEFGATVAIHEFIRGDTNGDGAIDVADAVSTLGVLFLSQPAICNDAIDANDDGAMNIADAIFLLAYTFEGAASPPPPFPGCGEDPTIDSLDCVMSSACP